MIRDEGQGDESVAELLGSPRSLPIRMAADTLQAVKMGIRVELSQIPADEYALMCCIEQQQNKHQNEKAKSQQHP